MKTGTQTAARSSCKFLAKAALQKLNPSGFNSYKIQRQQHPPSLGWLSLAEDFP